MYINSNNPRCSSVYSNISITHPYNIISGDFFFFSRKMLITIIYIVIIIIWTRIRIIFPNGYQSVAIFMPLAGGVRVFYASRQPVADVIIMSKRQTVSFVPVANRRCSFSQRSIISPRTTPPDANNMACDGGAAVAGSFWYANIKRRWSHHQHL